MMHTLICMLCIVVEDVQGGVLAFDQHLICQISEERMCGRKV